MDRLIPSEQSQADFVPEASGFLVGICGRKTGQMDGGYLENGSLTIMLWRGLILICTLRKRGRLTSSIID